MPGNVLIGKQLGDYKIVSSLGQGGMAHVYKGYDENLDRYAAVKVIEPTVMPVEDELEYRERFVREAKAIAKLNHPRIVGVYQFGKTEMTQELAAMYYMAMVFVEGRDLRQVLKEYTNRKRRMSNVQVLRIMRDVADALDYAHEQGVIHRDVKPSNIMITNEGRAVLTDFGLALRTQEGTMGNTFGSVHYIAPEQAVSSAQATAQSDLYSLGIVLYEIMTGRVPFDDNSAMSVALSQIQDPPPIPRSLNPAIPEEVEAVILKALEKEPMNRYQSGLLFVQALERAFASAVDEDTHDLDEATANPYNQLEKIEGHLLEDLGSTPLPAFKEITQHDKPSELADKVSDKVAAGARPGETVSDDVLQTSEKTSTSYPTPRDKREVVGAGGSGGIGGVTGSQPTSSANPESGSRAMWYAGGAAVLIIALLVMVLLAGGMGGMSDEDIAATSSASTAAAVALAADETSTQVALINLAGTETATYQPPTEEPSATPTDEPTPTAEEPSATPTDEPTPTAEEPSATPTDEATATPTSSPTPAVTSTPEISSAGSDEPQVLLRYDGRTVVIFNRSQDIISLGNLTFSGPAGDFRSDGWAQRFTVNPAVCYQVWTLEFATLSEDDFPADICASRRGFNATSRTFWISEEPATFEVRRGDLVLAECPTVPDDSREDQRCLVDVRGVTSP